jgi:hypothetical protein
MQSDRSSPFCSKLRGLPHLWTDLRYVPLTVGNLEKSCFVWGIECEENACRVNVRWPYQSQRRSVQVLQLVWGRAKALIRKYRSASLPQEELAIRNQGRHMTFQAVQT